jgi:hypothetical protein
MEPKRKKEELLAYYKKFCAERGATLNVSSDYYRWFIHLTDPSISRLIRILLFDRSAEITGWMTADPRMKSSQDIYDYIETMLWVTAHGFAQITDQNKLGCYAPVGPAPSDSEAADIDHRILASRSLFPQLVLETLGIDLLGNEIRLPT